MFVSIMYMCAEVRGQHQMSSGLVSIAMISTETYKIHLRKKGLTWFTVLGSRSVTEGRQGRNATKSLEHISWRKAIYWLAFYDLLSLLFYVIHDHLHRGRIKPQWAGPAHINH